MFENVYRVDHEPSDVTDADIAAVEALLGVAPAGYREYVITLGEGNYSGYVHVYPPRRILAEYKTVRRRLTEYWFWDDGADVASRADLAESVVLADTVDGDELFAHPASGRLLLLPRDEKGIYAFGYNLGEALHWLTTSGTLIDPLPEPQTYETSAGRRSIPFEGRPGISRRDVLAAVAHLASGARRDVIASEEDPGVIQFLPRIGGSVLVSGEGPDLWVSLTAARSATRRDVEAVASALAAVGLTRRKR